MNTCVYTIKPNMVNIIQTVQPVLLPPICNSLSHEIIDGVTRLVAQYTYEFILTVNNNPSVDPMRCTLVSKNKEWSGTLYLLKPLQFKHNFFGIAKDNINNNMLSLLMRQLQNCEINDLQR